MGDINDGVIEIDGRLEPTCSKVCCYFHVNFECYGDLRNTRVRETGVTIKSCLFVADRLDSCETFKSFQQFLVPATRAKNTGLVNTSLESRRQVGLRSQRTKRTPKCY